MSELIPNDGKKSKSNDDMNLKKHSPSPSIHSVPTHNGIPPVKFDGKIDLRRIFSFIEYKGLRFLILDCPTESTLPLIIAEFKKSNVTDVVRVCEPTYGTKKLMDENIQVLDIPYLDGGTPPPHVITKFLNLVQSRYPDNFPLRKTSLSASASQTLETLSPLKTSEDSPSAKSTSDVNSSEIPTIAVHCVAGIINLFRTW